MRSLRQPDSLGPYEIGRPLGTGVAGAELDAGETLADKLAREGALPLALVVELLLPICSAVAELHAAGIVHRDLKPRSILLTRGRAAQILPKVEGLGGSRLSDGALSIRDKSAAFATYAYTAPEQAWSPRGATVRSDLYSLGVIAYECATGEKPYAITTPLELLEAVVHGSAALPSALDPRLPIAFDAFVRKAMAREPTERFGSAEELGEALRAFATPEVSARRAGDLTTPRSHEAALASDSVTKAPRPMTPRGRGLLVGVAVAIVGFAVALGFAFTVPRGDEPPCQGAAGPSSSAEVACAVVSARPPSGSGTPTPTPHPTAR